MQKIVYVCPSLGRDCTWEGDITEIENHFEDFHYDLLLTDHNNIALSMSKKPLNRILIYNSEMYLIQTDWQPDSGLVILKIRQPGPPNGIKYHLNVRNVKNTNYLFSSKDADSGYNAVKNNNGAIEIDVSIIRMIVGGGEIVGALVFEEEVVRRQDSISLGRSNTFTQSVSIESEALRSLKRLFRSYSQLIEEPDDFTQIEEVISELEISEEDQCREYVQAYIQFLRKQKARLSRDETIFEPDEDCVDDCVKQEEDEESARKRLLQEQETKEQEEYRANLARIQCSNCARHMNPPIFVCLRGHSVCFYCQGDICHKCGDRITDLSNSDLEDISKSIPHPCRFTKQGCQRSIHYVKVHEHEIRCEHHFYTCPDLITCSMAPFQNKFGEMISHVRIMHPSIPVVNDSRMVPFTKGSEFFLINDEVGIFYCRVRGLDGSSLEFNVYFCGARDTYFFCHLQIKGRKGEDTFYLTRRGNLWCRTMTYKEIRDRKLKEKSVKLYILSH